MDQEALEELHSWLDSIPLARAKRSLTRDFSDGVLLAKVVKTYFPQLVEMNDYVPASSTQQKLSNWGQLNRKVFHRLNFYVPNDVITKIAQCCPGVVELVLSTLKQKIQEKLKQKGSKRNSSSQDLEYYSTTMEQTLGYSSVSPRPKTYSTGDGQQVQHGAKLSNPMNPWPANCPPSQQLSPEVQILLAEKQQELLASQETIQILQVKVRRLEHLLYLKDVRINDLTRRMQQREQR
uniref:Sperm flagellar 1 n=3 Tax=Callorhinchus milii TaxID=7868 RepID=A0A4W3GFV6_CALMI|eukprot:gi/632978858/ref/XP_007906149.1/ PREDICTED: sperm flagellar protein 1 [Callorhinchus milii]